MSLRSIHLGCVAATLLTIPAGATQWVVDQGGGGDFITIQAAISASSEFDEILVRPGTYLENIDFLGRDLYVHSSNGATATTIDGSAGATGDASCVTLTGGLTAAAVLEGFTLTGGEGTDYGSRLDDLSRDPMVGGAINCVSGAPRIQQCVIQENHADYAAGIFLDHADVEIVDCLFLNNTAATYGGAVAGPDSGPTIRRCQFQGNFAGSGDGTIHLELPATIEDCLFRGNEARAGAAINSPGYGADFQIRDCVFEGNVSHETHGGAIRVHEASPLIERCLFADNSALLDGGGIICLDGARAQILRCTFWANHAGRYGGCIAVYDSEPIVSRCILAGATNGGGLFASYASPDLVCDDAWSNQGGNYLGIPDPTGTGGNIAEDPLFCDPETGDFTLGADSPCAPDHDPDCGLIGRYEVGCQSTPVDASSWGAIKAMFR
jgi:predicted outer membrane repeat protein